MRFSYQTNFHSWLAAKDLKTLKWLTLDCIGIGTVKFRRSGAVREDFFTYP